MKKLILSSAILVAVTLVSYSASTNVKTRALTSLDPCEEYREMVYTMLLSIDVEEETACNIATLVQEGCNKQRNK